LRPPRPEPGFSNHLTRGYQERSSKTIRRSILQIVGIMKITEIVNNSPQSRRRRGRSVDLVMQRSGERSITPQDTIWRSARLFWITRRCQHLKWRRSRVEDNIIRQIPTMKTRWMRSM
jgi:hypothetical protein